MAYAARPIDFHGHIAPRDAAPASKGPKRLGFLTRLFNALYESREREAARNVEAYLSRTGYRFTDSIERELNERLFNGGWNPRR
jgi:hypothetical protein